MAMGLGAHSESKLRLVFLGPHHSPCSLSWNTPLDTCSMHFTQAAKGDSSFPLMSAPPLGARKLWAIA